MEDGTYTLSSNKKVDGTDDGYKLKCIIEDADGDTSEGEITLVIKDAEPQAFDNVAKKAEVDYKLGSFDSSGDDDGWLKSHSTSITYGATYDNDGVKYVSIKAEKSTNQITDANGNATGSSNSGPNMSSFGTALKDVTGFEAKDIFKNRGDGSIHEGGTITNQYLQNGGYIQKSFDLMTAGSIEFNYKLDRSSPSGWVMTPPPSLQMKGRLPY